MATKRKILYIITKSNFGGAQRYVFDLASHTKNDFDVVVAAGGDGILFEKLTKQGIRTITVPFVERDIHIWNEPRVIWAFLQILKNEKPDVIHLNSSKMGLLGGIAADIFNAISKDHKLKTVFTIHGFPFEEPRGVLWRGVIWVATWVSMLLADENIVVSKKDENIAQRMAFVGKKTHLIPNGVSPITFLPKNEAQQKILGKEFSGTVIGTIAELNHNKGLEYFLQAISVIQDKNIHYVIIGNGEKRKEFEDIIRIKRLPVTLAGYVDNAPLYLQAFNIFVLPSLKEGLPYVLLEAGSAGLPVVATSVGGVPDIIQNGVSGILVPPKDPQSLALALESYLHNQVLREDLARTLKKNTLINFNVEAMVNATVKLY